MVYTRQTCEEYIFKTRSAYALYYSRGVKAESNAQLVERVVRVTKECNRSVATPKEA